MMIKQRKSFLNLFKSSCLFKRNKAGPYLYGGHTGTCPPNILRFLYLCTPISGAPVNFVPTQYLVSRYTFVVAKE